MPELAFVMSPRQSPYLRELAETLCYELEQQAALASLEMDGFPEPRPGQVYVLVSPHEYLAVEGEAALPDLEILQRTILLCTRPFEELERQGPETWLRNAGAVFDIDLRSVALLRREGIPARHLRPGYSKLRDSFDPEAARPLDVMFLGVHTRQRTHRLRSCAPVLARRNCLLHVGDPAAPAGPGSSTVAGEAKWQLLRQTKVVLNLHRGSDSYLEWLRVVDAIHAGAVVVSEQASGLAPLVPGEHLLVAGPEALQFVIEAALRDPERLQRLRRRAYEHMRSVLPFALSVAVFRAAAVELVGRPVAAGAFRGGSTASPPAPLPVLEPAAEGESRATRRAFTEVSLEVMALRREVARLAEEGSRTTRRAFREVSLEVMALRREVARLEHVVRSGDETLAARREGETPAWSEHVPQVTIVTALHNRAGAVRATLDSVAGSWFGDIELVVVDDGSIDASSEVVRDWMQGNPLVPTVLERHPVERGIGAARNTGIESARAPYCLILDAGDEIHPRCLEVLVATVDAMDDVALVYPMVEVVGNVEDFVREGGDYLQGVFGWDPSRLMRSTHAESLALIRTERLREIGGFARDPELWGWEDYDLWCRMADRGWRGQIVPQILGRRRADVASVARGSNLTAAAPAQSLIERAPKLFTGQAAPALWS